MVGGLGGENFMLKVKFTFFNRKEKEDYLIRISLK